MAEMILVRHAQASFFDGNYDQLSEIGKQQAINLGAYLSAMEMTFDGIYIGTQYRHQQTLESILTLSDNNQADIQQNSGLNEYDFDAILHAYQTVLASKPANYIRHEAFKSLKAGLNAWANGELDQYVPESWADFEERITDALSKMMNEKHRRILVVTSGGPISTILKQVLNLPPSVAIDLNLQLKNTALCRCFFNAKSIKMASFNETPHILPNYSDLITFT